ncbi:hypothetical protein ACM16X_02655 [Haloarcula japonica]|uniref:hypothetical protein n=1 Tax=Haloarcula japonica TaxID=29282 RepID=UPI0039F73429
MGDSDKVEQVKKPSTGASLTRKINIGEKYESIKLEIWASSGTLDDTDQDTLKGKLEEIVEDLTEIIVRETEEWKAQDLDRDQLEEVLDQASRDLNAGNVEQAGEKLQNILRELQSR